MRKKKKKFKIKANIINVNGSKKCIWPIINQDKLEKQDIAKI